MRFLVLLPCFFLLAALPALAQQDPPPPVYSTEDCQAYESVCGNGQTAVMNVWLTVFGYDVGVTLSYCICLCDGAYVGPGCYGPRCPTGPLNARVSEPESIFRTKAPRAGPLKTTEVNRVAFLVGRVPYVLSYRVTQRMPAGAAQ